ncbi:MAG: trypsin-like serine protease [Deltaproteobacteria bacterium]|nr:trypsin-like serine protease [Deltaproteobacteria bacterium]
MPGRSSFGRALLLCAAAVSSAACAVAVPSDEREHAVGTSQSAIVGGEPSTAADDFVVFLSHLGVPLFGCGATLIAPNLVVTAKHCVYEWEDLSSTCGASGDPEPNPQGGGYVNAPIPITELGFYTRGDGRKRFSDLELPDAIGKKVIDDGTKMLCSHDYAFVVLDKPLSSLPIAKLRLGRRPLRGDKVAVAGWGLVEDRATTKFRQRRTDVPIRQVGPAVPPIGLTGGLVSANSFETGPGACKGDSGGPAFDLQTGTVLGVVGRAIGLVPTDPVSPCAPDTVSVSFPVIADFPKELKAAFAEAGAVPWLEGRAAPGYIPDGEACWADLECGGGRCAGATETRTGICKPDCTKPGVACPAGQVCGASATCEPAPPGSSTSSSGASSSGDPAAPAPSGPPVVTSASGCALTTATPSAATGLLVLACAGALVIRRRRHIQETKR